MYEIWHVHVYIICPCLLNVLKIIKLIVIIIAIIVFVTIAQFFKYTKNIKNIFSFFGESYYLKKPISSPGPEHGQPPEVGANQPEHGGVRNAQGSFLFSLKPRISHASSFFKNESFFVCFLKTRKLWLFEA